MMLIICLLHWNGTLYVATKAIEIGQAYTVDYNIERATVESFIKLYISNLKDYTDDLIDTIVGSLSDLTTENKDSVVNAINELVSTLSDVIDSIGTLSNLNTTAKDNIVNSINEVISNVGTLSNLNTSNKSNIVSAVNEVNSNVGTLFNLNTTNKSSTVAAINEVVKHISDLTGVRRVIIGDSYNVASVVTPTFGSLINDYLGNCINFGYGARGFAAATTFYESFSADLGSISDKENIKEVIVCAGANDVGQTFATLKSAISNFNTLIKTNFANAVLKIGFVGWSRYANDNWNETFRYYKKACDELGICYLNGVEIPLHNTQYLQTGGDSHHPNANGSAALAIAIVNALLSGDAAVDMLQRVTITQSGTHLIPAVAQYLYTGVKNGILSVNCKGIIYGNNGGSEAGVTALPVDTWVTIGTVEDSFLCVLDLENKARTIHALTGLLYDNKTKFAPIEFLIYGGGVVAIKNVSGAAITAAIGGEILPFSVSMPVTD